MKTQERVWLAKYPSDVPPSLTYPAMPLDALLREAAAKHPNAVATIFYGARMTYRDIDEGASALAGALARLGCHLGDRVALLLPNSPPFVMAYYGTLRAGGIVVQLNPLLSPHELRSELQDSGATVLITTDPLLDKASEAVQETGVRHVIVASPAAYVPLLMRPVVKAKARPKGEVRFPSNVQVHSFEALLKERLVPPKGEFDPKEQVAVFQYTGGTTGLPKAAMLTHFNLVANTYQIAAWVTRLEEANEVFLCVLPFFHSYGMTVGMNFAIFKAAAMLLLPRFDPAETAKAIQQHRATLFPGVPSMYAAVAYYAQRNRIDISSVKVCVSGGGPLPREVHERFVAVTGAKLWLNRSIPRNSLQSRLGGRKPHRLYWSAHPRHGLQNRGHRKGNERTATRRSRRIAHQRTAGDERLLEPPRRNCPGPSQRLAIYWRHRRYGP